MPGDRPRFLILRGGAIGDFLVTLPVLQALRERWPGAWIELLAYPHVADLAVVAGLADHVTSFHSAGAARLYAPRPAFTEEQRAFFRSFDVVLSYLHDPDDLVRNNLESAGARHIVRGSPHVETEHASDHLLRPLESLAIYAAGSAARLPLDETRRAAGRERLAPYGTPARIVVLHPGSGSPAKNWPPARFASLAAALRDTGRAPVFLFGEADADARDALADIAPAFPRLVDLTLLRCAEILSAASAYVGNDSGITHLAAAVGCPTLALFGPSNADLWSPRGPHAHTLRAPDGDLAHLPVPPVLDALLPLLPRIEA